MERRALLLGALCFAPFSTLAQSERNVSGLWAFSVGRKPEGAPSFEGVKYFSISRQGDVLRVSDLESGRDSVGTIQDNEFQFYAEGMKGAMSGDKVLFKASFNHGQLTGQTVSVAGTGPLVAYRLTGVWRCSNHAQRHISKSKDEMRSNTKDNNCQGWERVAG